MKITRDKLRGKKLEEFCKKANTTTKFGKYVVCFGLTKNNIEGTSEDMLEECVNCKAFVYNLKSPKSCPIEK